MVSGKTWIRCKIPCNGGVVLIRVRIQDVNKSRSIKCQRVGSAFFMFFSLLKRKLKDGGKKRSRMMAGGVILECY